jgi:hypothetical protein
MGFEDGVAIRQVVQFTVTCDRCGRQAEVTQEAEGEQVNDLTLPEGWQSLVDPRMDEERGGQTLTFDRRDCMSVWLRENVIDVIYGRRPRKAEREGGDASTSGPVSAESSPEPEAGDDAAGEDGGAKSRARAGAGAS